MSNNCSIGWLGITPSLISAACSSRMQQRVSLATAHQLVEQASGLMMLKPFETLQLLQNVAHENANKLFVIFFPVLDALQISVKY